MYLIVYIVYAFNFKYIVDMTKAMSHCFSTCVAWILSSHCSRVPQYNLCPHFTNT